jgi:phage repressor protein C with HTH and peptisase S24 domain
MLRNNVIALLRAILNNYDMENTINERINLLVKKSSSRNINAFAKEHNIPQTTLNNCIKKGNEPKYGLIYKLYNAVPLLNLKWLLTGEGEMLLEKDHMTESYSDPPTIFTPDFQKKGYTPYYPDLLISAGQYDLATIIKEEKPASWIRIPGVSADAWFPIVGCSMEPKIYAGDMIGIQIIDSLERLDPDKIYLIITQDDQMIKHLEINEKEPEIIWAISENYRRIRLHRDKIKRVFQVVFSGRVM